VKTPNWIQLLKKASQSVMTVCSRVSRDQYVVEWPARQVDEDRGGVAEDGGGVDDEGGDFGCFCWWFGVIEVNVGM
jgi:hypothetical protein